MWMWIVLSWNDLPAWLTEDTGICRYIIHPMCLGIWYGRACTWGHTKGWSRPNRHKWRRPSLPGIQPQSCRRWWGQSTRDKHNFEDCRPPWRYQVSLRISYFSPNIPKSLLNISYKNVWNHGCDSDMHAMLLATWLISLIPAFLLLYNLVWVALSYKWPSAIRQCNIHCAGSLACLKLACQVLFRCASDILGLLTIFAVSEVWFTGSMIWGLR